MNSPISITGFNLTSTAFYLAKIIKETNKKIIVFVETREKGENLTKLIKNFLPETNLKFFNLSKFFPFSKILRDKTYIPELIELLYTISLNKRDIVIIPISLLLKKFISPQLLIKESLNIRLNEELDREGLIEQLVEWGYERESFVTFKGEFSVRGDIIDIFPPLYDNPLRINFFGDVVDAIYFFNPFTQRRINEELKSIDVVSCTEVLIKNEIKAEDYKIMPGISNLDTASLFDYVKENYIKVIFTKEGTLEKLNTYHLDLQEHFKGIDIKYEDVFYDVNKIVEKVKKCEIKFCNLIIEDDNFINLKTESYKKFHIKLKNDLKPLIDEVISNKLKKNKIAFFVFDSNKTQFLKDALKKNSVEFSDKKFSSLIEYYYSETFLPAFFPGEYFEGFYSDYFKIAIFNEKDIFGKKLKKITPKIDENLRIRHFSEIKEGDYIVHVQHGIGIFKGLKNLEFSDTKKDFFIIEYAGGDKLYVPIDKTNMLQKYIGRENYIPVIDKLGSNRWQKAKEKVIQATELIAKDILNLYAKRKLLKGISFKCDESLIDEFSYKWEYEETEDQIKAISDVFDDMDKDSPMDRLLCGDVGFGKTEVAIRAILKAVICGYQVAFLVPTTVLALQHYEVLSERFKDYPFIIKKISRFESKKEQNKIVEDLKSGKIDIVIGTHRLLQDDISFKNLGLLIIDEEHKFGVKHKEKIKMLKSNVDVLYMTATPIPRTLQLSLIGIKDLSVIQTPPAERKEIETKIIRFDKNIIRNAIIKELNRGGQVFFVHNIVKSIYPMANFLKKIVPEANIIVAHAQMKEAELEKVIKDFITKKYNVLVCTTIIESGLDMPNVNTIIINRADRFGLSQLYQLRGRVGRSNVKAYAYLIIPGEEIIKEKAIKRLRVLQQYSNLSQGLKIAMNDLELRGAGNLFGKEQSGKILSVGYEFFLETLEDAIKKLRGEEKREKIDPEITVPFSFYIPDSYIEDEKERFYFYKKLASIESFDELNDIQEELLDRFGKFPEEVKNLFYVISLKVLFKRYNILKANLSKKFITLTINKKTDFSIEKIVELVNKKKAEIVSHETLKIFFDSTIISEQIEELKSIFLSIENK